MSRELLFSIIQYLHNIDYAIAVTCDMSSTNIKEWNELQIGADENSIDKTSENTEKKCFFVPPSNDTLKIFFYANVSHLIKLVKK